METSTPAQLCFPAIAGFTVRGDFEGGALSSDFGALLLHGVDRQTGLVNRGDRGHPRRLGRLGSRLALQRKR